jgi:hypothetical protein
MTCRQGYLFAGLPEPLNAFVGFTVRATSTGDKIRAAQLAMLETLLRHGGTASVDSIVRDLAAPFSDGGRWLGPAVKELAADGLLLPAGATNSRRQSRNAGLTMLWQLGDRRAAQVRVTRLRAALNLEETDDPAAATAEPPKHSKRYPLKGNASNGKVD